MHARSRLDALAVDAQDRAVVIANGGERRRPIRDLFAPVLVPVRTVLKDLRRPAGVQRRVDGAQLIPDVRPDLPSIAAEGPRLLGKAAAERAHVVIVVDQDFLGSGMHDRRKTGVEAELYGGAQRRVPCLDGAEWRGRPIERATTRAHLAGPLESQPTNHDIAISRMAGVAACPPSNASKRTRYPSRSSCVASRRPHWSNGRM